MTTQITPGQLIEVLKTVCITDEFGSKCWYLNGQRHRVDGPAIDRLNGDKYWYRNGQWHRVDGPAIEYADGNRSWYLYGRKLTEEEFNKRVNDLQSS